MAKQLTGESFTYVSEDKTPRFNRRRLLMGAGALGVAVASEAIFGRGPVAASGEQEVETYDYTGLDPEQLADVVRVPVTEENKDNLEVFAADVTESLQRFIRAGNTETVLTASGVDSADPYAVFDFMDYVNANLGKPMLPGFGSCEDYGVDTTSTEDELLRLQGNAAGAFFEGAKQQNGSAIAASVIGAEQLNPGDSTLFRGVSLATIPERARIDLMLDGGGEAAWTQPSVTVSYFKGDTHYDILFEEVDYRSSN